MKRLLTSLACTSALALGAFTASAEDSPASCSLSTLRGTYAFAGTNTTARGPMSTSGIESYDGLGHLKYYQLYNRGGVAHGVWTGTGTYSFAPATQPGFTASCVATVIYDGDTAHPWTYFVAPDGAS